MNLEIGSKIRWESAAGVKRGIIKNIVLRPAANHEITPWIDVELNHGPVAKHHVPNYMVRICASDDYLKMMSVTEVTK